MKGLRHITVLSEVGMLTNKPKGKVRISGLDRPFHEEDVYGIAGTGMDVM